MASTEGANESRVKLRPVTPQDEDFLYRVYAGTREDIAQLGWDDKQKEKFLRLQFMAQHNQYKAQFVNAEFQIILADVKPAGRLYINRTEEEIRIVDIALLPEFRGKGMGSSLLKRILGEGKQKRLPVRIHVQQSNPAFHLYQRLGFQKIDENGVYFLMEWTSNQNSLKMLNKLTSADFFPHLNQAFKIHYHSTKILDAQLILEVELIEVADYAERLAGPSKRPPFSILFRGPKDINLPQGTYQVEHDKMGTVELFLVPIMPDENGSLYESVFN